jgi:hypothetical protein
VTEGTTIDEVLNRAPRRKQRWRDWLFGQALAFLFCVLFPAFVTAVAPISTVSFVRENAVVSAVANTKLLFLIPYRIQRVNEVIGIDDRFTAGKVERRPGKNSTRSEDQAFLVIHGEDATAEVPVTPFNIDSVSERATAFLNDAEAKSLSMTVVANWKFSVIAGGLISLLTVLYVVGLAWGLVRGLMRIASPPVEVDA